MKTTNLEYTNISVKLPDIDYFLEKIINNKKINFIRVNHGFIDGLYYSYSNFDNLKNDLLKKDYNIIGKNIQIAYSDKDWGSSYFHGNTNFVSEYSSILLKLVYENKLISENLDIGLSLGVGLNTFWGVWNPTHHLQMTRTKFANLLNNITEYNFFYSGIIKHYTIKREIHKLFKLLNLLNYDVIFLGPKHFDYYEKVFAVKNFHFVEIPPHRAIIHTEKYIESIKKILNKTKNKTILFYMTGHIMSAKITYELLDCDISTIDVGRSFDILIKEKFINGNQAQRCWTFLDESALNNYVNDIRK